MCGLTEADYIEAFNSHFKHTVSWLHVRYRVQTAEAAREYALEAWGDIWKYREQFDPEKSSIATFARMRCFQVMLARRSTLWERARMRSELTSVEVFQYRDSSKDGPLPKPLRVAPSEERINRLDAELILACCREHDASILRRYYLEELPVPRSSLKKARDRARECVRSFHAHEIRA